jgi:hypothetical protein
MFSVHSSSIYHWKKPYLWDIGYNAVKSVVTFALSSQVKIIIFVTIFYNVICDMLCDRHLIAFGRNVLPKEGGNTFLRNVAKFIHLAASHPTRQHSWEVERSWGGGGSQWCCCHRQQSPRGGKLSGKVNILNDKKMIFCTHQILNCWAKYKEIQYIFLFFLKFIISVRGGHYSHRQENLTSHTNEQFLYLSWKRLSNISEKFADTYR